MAAAGGAPPRPPAGAGGRGVLRPAGGVCSPAPATRAPRYSPFARASTFAFHSANSIFALGWSILSR